MAKRWRIRPYDAGYVAEFARRANVAPVVAQLLLAHGITRQSEIQTFLEAKLTGLRDPDQLPGLATAADRIFDAVRAGRNITVYGDYDADGMTGTAILLRCLSQLGANVNFYVPNRLDDGYGVKGDALRTLANRGTQLVITVDCGITSVQEAEVANEIGIELIITDHHLMAAELPNASVIVHPSLPETDYPFTGLCGAGVALKLAWGLCQRASDASKVQPRLRAFLLQALGLAAIGTVADVVPLLDENRLIVRHGLKSLLGCPSPGIAAMLHVTKLAKKPALGSEDIAFMIAPRLNAAGRLGQADLAVELLTTDSDKRARDLAEYLQELNVSRDSLERSIYLAANKQAKQRLHDSDEPALVLAGRGWHVGVIGIVAGRLAEKYCRPVIMISLDELGSAAGTGSARSALGLDLHSALDACADELAKFGGHAAAAGLQIEEQRIPRFRERFCQEVAERIPADQRVAELQIDSEAPLAQLTLRTVKQIEQLAPFGQANPRPLLCASEVKLNGPPKKMGSGERHLSLQLQQYGVTLRAVAFGQGYRYEEMCAHAGEFDVAYRPVINEFNGRRSVELQLVDWRPHRAAVLL